MSLDDFKNSPTLQGLLALFPTAHKVAVYEGYKRSLGYDILHLGECAILPAEPRLIVKMPFPHTTKVVVQLSDDDGDVVFPTVEDLTDKKIKGAFISFFKAITTRTQVVESTTKIQETAIMQQIESGGSGIGIAEVAAGAKAFAAAILPSPSLALPPPPPKPVVRSAPTTPLLTTAKRPAKRPRDLVFPLKTVQHVAKRVARLSSTTSALERLLKEQFDFGYHFDIPFATPYPPYSPRLNCVADE